jgi:hypothetical protein
MYYQWHIKAGENYVCGYTIGEYSAYADTTIMREKAITFMSKRYAFSVCNDLNGGVVDASTYRVVRRKADWT